MQYPAYVSRELEFATTIRRGERGMRVKRAQEWLGIHGCSTPIDSDFGDATKRTVEEFQRRKGLGVTGAVDRATWDALIEPMTKALAPTAALSSMSSSVLRVAKQHLAQHPVEAGGDNRGPWVRIYCNGNDGPDWRWCAGFVTFIVRQACLASAQVTPFPGSVSCDSLAHQARTNGLFVKGADLESGAVDWDELGSCQVFLSRRTPTDWVHTGFSFDGEGTTFATIEGNTNDSGSANGFEACRRTRSVASKDFIRFPS